MHPEYEVFRSDDEEAALHLGRIAPIYRAIGKTSTKQIRTVMWRALESVKLGEDPLPEAVRRRLALLLQELGFELANAIHPHAFLAPEVQLGRGVIVLPGAVLAELVLQVGGDPHHVFHHLDRLLEDARADLAHGSDLADRRDVFQRRIDERFGFMRGEIAGVGV